MLFKTLSSMRTWLYLLKCILVITKLLSHVKATELAPEVTLSHWESNRKWLLHDLHQDGLTSPSHFHWHHCFLCSLPPKHPFPSSPLINFDPPFQEIGPASCPSTIHLFPPWSCIHSGCVTTSMPMLMLLANYLAVFLFDSPSHSQSSDHI